MKGAYYLCQVSTHLSQDHTIVTQYWPSARTEENALSSLLKTIILQPDPAAAERL